jgi:DNA (cytosine-5)-methyltransferase 1
MRVGSLFSGIGGFDLGLERAGHSIVWQVENDAYCRKVLAKHWPDVPCYEDVHDCGTHNLEEVDVICGGFPCQPVSTAGKQLAQDDERWLWPEFARVIRELQPRYVLVENVPGLLVRGLGDVLGDLAAAGYDAEWGCVSAASVGAPHLRKRIFIMAHRERERLEGHAGDGDHGHESRRLKARPNRSTGEGCLPPRDRPYGDYWAVEPNVGRVADGVPARVDRLRALGNAIVPQVAEWVGRQLPSEAE